MKKKVKAPKGYHFMKVGKGYRLMKNKGKFVPHKGASTSAEFEVITKHKWASLRKKLDLKPLLN